MPRDKTASREKIIAAARQEFLENGYEKASLRHIADTIGMSVAGLYRHFPDKAAMFDYFVEPALSMVQSYYDAEKESDFQWLEGHDLDAVWESAFDQSPALDLIYEQHDAFHLLLCCAGGSRHETFVRDYVEMEARDLKAFIAAAKEAGYRVAGISDEEMRMVLTAYFEAFFEIIRSDVTLEEAKRQAASLARFFAPGWKALFSE
ncbi:MAG: TetR/AcrR family transcriptional regulator [Clostridia bacterium]|nr:TetR/AcrR family transcriptional regulator [Clostridia bacterium]